MRDIVAIDFEYTGSSLGYINRPWQVGLALLQKGRLCPGHSFSSLLQVPADQPFNQYAPGRWASIREELAQAPDIGRLWSEMAPWLQGKVLLAHNVPVERAMLEQCFPCHHFGPWLDSLVLARMAFPAQISYKLEDLCANLGLQEELEQLCPGRGPHDALYDAMASAKLLEFILSEPSWREAGLDRLCALSPGKS
ncbi:MAG: hypothetical protein GX946_05815 [Oligosphaeraceae bacterium]|nr:hypothetical protein [Oligosphaeraceae bacterium]